MEVFDRKTALANLNGDEQRLSQLVEEFQVATPAAMTKMSSLLSDGSDEKFDEIARCAESLGGAARLISAEGLADLTRQIVDAAKSSDSASIENYLTFMEMEFDWIQRIWDENRCSGNL